SGFLGEHGEVDPQHLGVERELLVRHGGAVEGGTGNGGGQGVFARGGRQHDADPHLAFEHPLGHYWASSASEQQDDARKQCASNGMTATRASSEHGGTSLLWLGRERLRRHGANGLEPMIYHALACPTVRLRASRYERPVSTRADRPAIVFSCTRAQAYAPDIRRW